MFRLPIAITVTLLLAMPAQATVLEFKSNGETIRHESVDYLERRRNSGDAKELYTAFVAAASMTHQVDEDLIHAVIHAESSYRKMAISSQGAEGLMQLLPATALRFDVADSFNPADNINGGTAYLSWLLHHYDGDEELALAAYNAGEDTVDRYHSIPPYPETIDYLRKIRKFLRRPFHTPENAMQAGQIFE